jgi:endonuclease/exonuclease/phosphatase family metal-dependent hydrolase
MMRKVALFVAAFLVAAVAGDDDVEVHIMSFNVRTSLASTDSGSTCSNWDGIRKDNVISNIKTVAADFVGTQETSDAQKTYLDAQLAGTYSVIGESTGSLNGNANEWDALYYRSDTWSLLTNGMFWLGTDPDTMTAGWGMTYYRTCVWGRFQHIATGATICVLNTHYETPGNDEAQENGSNIILERIKTNCDANDNLIVLTGDFNALKSYSAMQILFANDMEDPSDAATFCGDMLSATCSVKYDFTLYRAQSDDACYLKSEVSRIDYDGCYSSDHAGLVGSFCLQGSCCSNSSSSTSGSGSEGSYSQDYSVAGESDVLGTVQASDLSGSGNSKTASKTDTESDSSSSGTTQTISTSSAGGGSASTTVGIILGSLGACGLVALVVIRRKRTLEARSHFEKSYDPDASGYFAGGSTAARAVSDMSALSPLPEEDGERVSSSPIPELAAVPRGTRISTSSSVSVSDSEAARHDDRFSELPRASSAHSQSSSRRSSTAVMDQTHSQYSSSFSNSVLECEGDFNTSVISYGNSSISSYSSETYGNSSIGMSKVNFSEIFAPDSCTSDDSELAKSQADFAKL